MASHGGTSSRQCCRCVASSITTATHHTPTCSLMPLTCTCRVKYCVASCTRSTQWQCIQQRITLSRLKQQTNLHQNCGSSCCQRRNVRPQGQSQRRMLAMKITLCISSHFAATPGISGQRCHKGLQQDDPSYQPGGPGPSLLKATKVVCADASTMHTLLPLKASATHVYRRCSNTTPV